MRSQHEILIEVAVDKWAVFSEFTIYILRFGFGLCIGVKEGGNGFSGWITEGSVYVLRALLWYDCVCMLCDCL